MPHTKSNLRVLFIFVAALAVRLLGIATRPIWYDEAFSILFSEKGLGPMLYGTLAATGSGTADIHPLGYYTLLWLWMKVFGESLTAVRLLSILGGLGVVILIYFTGRELFGETTAQLAMLFAALAPFQLHYAQEIRMYSFMAAWLLLATYAYVRGSRTGQRRWWILFAVSCALAQYTQNLSAFYLVVLAMTPILRRDWKSLKAVIFAGLGALILYIPWLIELPGQFAKVEGSYWVARPDVSRLFTLLLVYITNLPLPDNWLAIALFIALIVVTIGILQSVRRTVPKRAAAEGLWTLYLSFGPPLLLFLFSQWKPVYIERALVASGAVFALWLAWVVTCTKMPRPVQGFICILLATAALLGVYEHIAYKDFPYGPFQALDASIRSRIQPGDRIVHSNKLSLLPAIYFDRALPQAYIADAPGSAEDTLAPATQEVLGVSTEPTIQTAVGNAPRVWYIIYQNSIDEFQSSGQGTPPDLVFLNAHYTLRSKEVWDGLVVYLYARNQ
ncbi:MAG TPA: glycosyltransferase family 39 protein [Anaerolineales bacterium]|nr:glycosyltransferase family 39 protein [Anaerolineales bacterium]